MSNRRTFAIISHPDAGKTTLTEKLLLQGGAIHLAGEVKARGQARRARSDWMKIEQQRGISVTSSVMTFEKEIEGETITFNLLDTPGHEDFSEDTYRTLTAVDSAVMVIDAATARAATRSRRSTRSPTCSRSMYRRKAGRSAWAVSSRAFSISRQAK